MFPKAQKRLFQRNVADLALQQQVTYFFIARFAHITPEKVRCEVNEVATSDFELNVSPCECDIIQTKDSTLDEALGLSRRNL